MSKLKETSEYISQKKFKSVIESSDDSDNTKNFKKPQNCGF